MPADWPAGPVGNHFLSQHEKRESWVPVLEVLVVVTLIERVKRNAANNPSPPSPLPKVVNLPNLLVLLSFDALAQLAAGDGTLLKITIRK